MTLGTILLIAAGLLLAGGVMVLCALYVADTDEKALRKRIDSERIR